MTVLKAVLLRPSQTGQKKKEQHVPWYIPQIPQSMEESCHIQKQDKDQANSYKCPSLMDPWTY